MIKKFLILFLLLCFVKAYSQKQNFTPPRHDLKNPTKEISTSAETQYRNKELFPMAVIGELRPVTFTQTLFFWESIIYGDDIDFAKEKNDEERYSLLKQIVRERSKSMVLLGNFVHHGSKKYNWRMFDDLIEPIYSNKIEVLPIMGEHEYWGRKHLAKSYAKKRFPIFDKHFWYSSYSGDYAFLFLNSNIDEMSHEDWNKQFVWYLQKLREFEADPQVKGIVVFLHHAPFTNSGKDDAGQVHSYFLQDFLKSDKTLAMISGNSAVYEHFVMYDKHFINSGGGGAPRDALSFDNIKYEDKYTNLTINSEDVKLPFHFLLLEPKGDTLSITVKGLNSEDEEIKVLEEIKISLPAKKELPVSKPQPLKEN